MRVRRRMVQTGKKFEASLTGLVLAATFSRLIINTTRRFPYTFAPVLSRGMGVPLTAVTGLIGLSQITAFMGIFFGPLADRFGYRTMMIGGLGMLILGMFAGGLLPFYGVIFCSIFLSGLAKSVFDPSLQAYIGQRTPFERRGRIVGIMEVCWAGSTLVGIPLVAICINRFNWYSPFFLMSGLGLIGWLFLFRLLEKDRSSASAHTSPQQSIMNPWKEMLYAWRTLLQKKMNLCVLGSAFCVGASSDNIFVIYGAWLEQSFGLSVISLGLGTTVIGFAELIGEVLTASSGDRLGLGRSAALGLALNVFLCMLLPFFTQTLFFALTGLFLIFLTFEFNIVATLCLCTELIPGQRATMMSAFLAMASLGRLIGALAGGPLWLSGGIKATSFVSTVFGALGLVLLLFGLMKYQRIHSS